MAQYIRSLSPHSTVKTFCYKPMPWFDLGCGATKDAFFFFFCALLFWAFIFGIWFHIHFYTLFISRKVNDINATFYSVIIQFIGHFVTFT